jgi:hypothetical protein
MVSASHRAAWTLSRRSLAGRPATLIIPWAPRARRREMRTIHGARPGKPAAALRQPLDDPRREWRRARHPTAIDEGSNDFFARPSENAPRHGLTG